MNHARHKRNLGYQSLEARKMLAGDVTVVEDGNLYIRGDAADNQFELVAVGDQLQVNGLQGTTINGQDGYLVAGATVTDAGVAFEGGLRAHLGPGSDDLMIQDAVFESFSIIFGGTGDDNIEVVDTDFMDKVVVQTYDGDDSISTTRSHFEGPLYIHTLDGQDSVSMTDSMFAGDSFVVTGNHSDTIHSENNHYMGDVNLILSLNGDDTVQLTNPVVGESQLGVFLGNHDDTIGVDLTDASVDGTIKISGQAGMDQRSDMLMSDEVADKTTVLGVEKGMLVFQSAVGGVENVTNLENSFTEPAILDSSGNFTNTYSQQYATAVVLENTQTIHQVEWSGGYQRDLFTEQLPDLGDSFVIEIIEGTDAADSFDEYGRLPAFDASQITRFAVGSAARVVAGEISYGEFGDKPVYEYHADIEYTMEAGKQYWVSIYTDLAREQAMNGDLWQWGMRRSSEYANSVSSLFSGGFSQYESLWSQDNAEGPVYAEYVELDLRLRSEAT